MLALKARQCRGLNRLETRVTTPLHRSRPVLDQKAVSNNVDKADCQHIEPLEHHLYWPTVQARGVVARLR